MNFAQLRAFHAVAEHGSFSRAAGALSVTQPAVSAQVKGLEESYGVTLFERHARGISLTEPGRRLFDVTRRLFQLEDEADATLRSEHEKPPELFRLGSDAPYSLSRLLSGYCQAHPGTQVSHVMGTAEELQQEIVNERLDVAVVVRVQDDPRLLITRFAAHRIVVIVPKDHPWAGRADVGLEELDGVGMVLRDPRHSLTNQTFEAALRRRHVKPDVIMRVDSRENLREGVSAGVGIGLTTDADAATDFRIKGVPLSDPGMFITDYVVCLRRRRGVRTIADFIALADELVRSGAIQAPA